MKRVTILPRPPPGWVFPAPHRAGLIEASLPLLAAVLLIFAFPAPHRAGLIEAYARLADADARQVFPAPHRAGLIEAAADMSGHAVAGISGFRLLTEPASLKQPVGRIAEAGTTVEVSGSSQSRPH